MNEEGIIPLIKKGIFSSDRNRFYCFYFLIFLLPLLAFYAFPAKFFLIFFISFCAMSLLVRSFEKKMQASVSKLVKMKMEKIGALQEKEKEAFLKNAEREIEELKQREKQFLEEKEAICRDMEASLLQKDILSKEYQQTIFEQRAVIEKSKRMMFKLQTRVQDLTYEIKSLLHIDDSSLSALEIPLPKKKKKTLSPYDLGLTLQKYVEMAESTKSSQSGRFSLNSLSIDHRPFFEALQKESETSFFVYCLVEEKMIFVNNAIKSILNVSPDRFIKEFPKMIILGDSEWQKALVRLKNSKEEKCRVVMGAQEDIVADCLMASITKGPFAFHIIGSFY